MKKYWWMSFYMGNKKSLWILAWARTTKLVHFIHPLMYVLQPVSQILCLLFVLWVQKVYWMYKYLTKRRKLPTAILLNNIILLLPTYPGYMIIFLQKETQTYKNSYILLIFEQVKYFWLELLPKAKMLLPPKGEDYESKAFANFYVSIPWAWNPPKPYKWWNAL